MNADIAVVLISIGIGYVLYRVTRRKPVGNFNTRRASMNSRSIAGPNATLMLAAASLAGLAVSLTAHASRWQSISRVAAPALVLLLIGAVVVLVLGGARGGIVVGLLGLAAEVVSAGLEHGPAGAMAVIVLAALLVYALGLVRGLVR